MTPRHNHTPMVRSLMDRLGLGSPESDLPEMHQHSLFTKVMSKTVHETEQPDQSDHAMHNGVRVLKPEEEEKLPEIRSQHELTRSIGAVPMQVVEFDTTRSNDSGNKN